MNVDGMIQSGLVPQHREADVPPRTHEDVRRTGIWPTNWSPNEMLCKINDGHIIFKDNPMALLTPLGREDC